MYNISIEKKFPRYYNLSTIFDNFDSGTFIIPSCGIINNHFDVFYDTLSINKSKIDFLNKI